MVTVNELPPKTAQETYVIFSKLKESFGSEEFNFSFLASDFLTPNKNQKFIKC